MLLLNRGGGLWGLGIPGEGGQVWAGLPEVDLSVTGFASDGHFCWLWTYCHAEHHLKKEDRFYSIEINLIKTSTLKIKFEQNMQHRSVPGTTLLLIFGETSRKAVLFLHLTTCSWGISAQESAFSLLRTFWPSTRTSSHFSEVSTTAVERDEHLPSDTESRLFCGAD